MSSWNCRGRLRDGPQRLGHEVGRRLGAGLLGVEGQGLGDLELLRVGDEQEFLARLEPEGLVDGPVGRRVELVRFHGSPPFPFRYFVRRASQ